ncbi:lactonase family protein [Hymenobacter caeli]|uniref:6-phosphogluconolactonase n=1 Tax=Hymenobacter caeli TaxID=2735894 RepID=A0ABX2FUP2_9BACT|nr:lactonase family protein [Hymenobacter caeli]NRT20905.1 6-phosphogluconolactonase [Hymenobacter caeli]
MSQPVAFRRYLFPLAAFGLAAGSGLGLAGCARTAPAASSGASELVYIGTNVASAQENTIYLYRLNPATGALAAAGAYKGGAQPSYLTMDAAHRHLYAVSETGTFKGQDHCGGVSTLAIDGRTGALALLGQQPSTGASPCYINLDHTGKNALVANYMGSATGGNVALLPVQPDGQLAPATATDQHQPPVGPHPNQTTPHAHSLLPDPANRFAFGADLGTDKVYGYRLDAARHTWQPLPAPAFVAKPGAGPRHLTFHPNGRYAYLANELNSTVTALAYDAAAGSFRELQTLTTLPAGFAETNSVADVHVGPNGKFLYVSNRGRNSIAVFAIGADGQLAPVQDVDTQGKTPRNFALDPSGRLLLVANQNSNNVFTYRVDQQTGKLTPTGQHVDVPSPMFVEVVPDFTR